MPKYISGFFLIFTLALSCTNSKTYTNVANQVETVIDEIYADTSNFRSKNICTVEYYQLASNQDQLLLINNTACVLVHKTEYLQDGRRRYREEAGEEYKYHYNDSDKLILKEVISKENHWLTWISYDADKIKDEIEYTLNSKGVQWNYYKTYTISDSVIDIQYYSSDTIANTERYYFEYPYRSITYQQGYQINKRIEQFINGKYKAIRDEGYVFDDREVIYTYNDDGFITSEIWEKPKGVLENKIAYAYSANYAEQVEQRYDYKGQVKSLKIIRRYDPFSNLVFEERIEPSSKATERIYWEYVYDEQQNWIERFKYREHYEKGIARELLNYEMRKITYYKPFQSPRTLTLPTPVPEMGIWKEKIPQWAEMKYQKAEAFANAVETEAFDKEIKTKSALQISDFTPQYWIVKGTAYGDLDQIEGDEAAVVYQTPQSNDFGYMHCLAIYKKENTKWQLWKQCTAPLLSTGEGGVWGDPFDSISIVKHSIVLSHFGGSRQKWAYQHHYQYRNNNWYLIFVHSHFDLSNGDTWQDADYDLITGKLRIETCQCTDFSANPPTSVCESKQYQINKISLPLMDTFVPGATALKVEEEVYY